MTKQEYSNRNIGLTFDFLREIVKNPTMLESIPDKAVIDFVDKDFSQIEKPKTIKPNKYIKVKNSFELL